MQTLNGSTQSWPRDQLDVTQLRVSGWQPLPFDEFIVKIHSRCNLACDYCYVYEMADQSWMAQPKMMDRATMADIAQALTEHTARFSLPKISVVLHGGEPLLARHDGVNHFLSLLCESVGRTTELTLGIQTNGVLLDEEFLKIFKRWNVAVGISLDGNREANDRHRRYKDGRGSYADVADRVNLLSRGSYRDLFAGLLCTIDVDNDPVETYEELISFKPPAIDLLLPHGNWTTPPPHRESDASKTPYADWLCAVFDRWYSAPQRETGIRFFDDLIDLLLGGKVGSESLGLSPIRLAVIETDGTLEQVDSLKSAFDGATRLGVKATQHTLAEALWDPAIVARQIGTEALSLTCRECPLYEVCGGGHFTHRYEEFTGFRNPSVYCADLKKIIEHVAAKVKEDLIKTASPAG